MDHAQDPAFFLSRLWDFGPDGMPPALSASIGLPRIADDGKESWPPSHWQPGIPLRAHTHWSPMLQSRHEKPRNTVANAMFIGAFIADDIGVKGKPVPGLTPFARIETSPGSEQWVYALDTAAAMDAEDEAAEVRAVVRMLPAGGFSDKNGNNPVRWARLPTTKVPQGKTHAARLVEMTGHRHSMVEIINALEMELPADKVSKAWSEAYGAKVLTGDAQTLAKADPTFGWLLRKGWVQGLSGSGPWWRVRCPLGHEHSDGKAEVGCRYLPSKDLGGWVCDRGTTPETDKGHVAQRAAIINKPPSQVFREALAEHGGPPAPAWRGGWSGSPVFKPGANAMEFSRKNSRGFVKGGK